jgi:hypothetical protein
MGEVEEVGNKMQSQTRLHAAAAAAAAEGDDDDADLPLPALFDRASRLHGLASSSALDQVSLPPPTPGCWIASALSQNHQQEAQVLTYVLWFRAGAARDPERGRPAAALR